MKKTLIIVAIIITLLIGGIVLFGWFSQRQMNALMADLETETVQQGTLSSSVGATGLVRANQNAYLVWKISGQVDQVLVEAGDTVNAGDILAVLDDTSLPAYIILAQADLVNAQNQLDTLLISSLQQAEALKAVEEADKALDDALNPELAQAQAQVAIAAAEADLDTAETQMAILTKPVSQAAVDQAYANLLMAEKQLNDLQDQIADKERKSKGPYDKPWESQTFYRRVLEGLNMQLPQLQLRYEEATNKYNNLLEPPDPLDVAIAEAAVFAAQAQLDDALLQYERIKDGASPADIAVLEAQLADAQREYERVKDGAPSEDIAILEAQIAASEATLLQTRITAPFDGTITLVEALQGDQVSTGSLAFRIDDLSLMLVDLNVSEIDINLVQLGQEVVVTFDAILAKEYHGQVVDVAPIGNTDTGITSFTVTVELLDADEEIRPGMTSEVSIITSEVENALLVPNRAIRLLDGERVVYVLRDTGMPGDQQLPLNSIVPISVTLGTTSDLYSEVLNGDLTNGDIVILNPPSDGIVSNRGGGIRVQINP
jgi:HlyD family secretion protein